VKSTAQEQLLPLVNFIFGTLLLRPFHPLDAVHARRTLCFTTLLFSFE
jgi:hypothetical protein